MVVARLNGFDTGVPDWKSHRRMKITDKVFSAGQIVGAVCLQGRLVRIICHDGEIVWCGGKRNSPEARTFRLLLYREDMQVCWVVDNYLAFGEDDFKVGVSHRPKTNQGMLEQRHEFY